MRLFLASSTNKIQSHNIYFSKISDILNLKKRYYFGVKNGKSNQ